MARVLVTDGEERSALAAVRSLGRAGHRVDVVSATGASLAGASRHARTDHRVPGPAPRPAAFRDGVAALAADADVDVLLPASEASMRALLPARETLGPAVLPFGGEAAFRALSDKRRLLALAQEVGLAVPRQLAVTEPGGVDDPGLGWPVVVKPSRSLRQEDGALRKQGVAYAGSAAELRRMLAELPGAAFPVLLQERIVGPGTGVFLLRWEGETLAAFAHRRLREKPPSGGVSVYREAVEADPELVRRSERLLRRVGWRGVAMVEFKTDRETGVPHVMEVNARLWGSLQLAVDAGVDFPRLLVGAALDRPAEQATGYRAGVRCRWWWGDVDHLIARLGGEAPADAEEAPMGRLRAVLAFLLLWRPGDRFEVLRVGDPRPFVRETRQWVGSALRGVGSP